MELHLYNTLDKKVQPFTPIDAGKVRMYSCGPTVYNHAHIGNMRSFLFADLLQRTLRTVGGLEVRWVMNLTDIDDKTIRDSAIGSTKWLPAMGEQTGDARTNLRVFTEYFSEQFFDDITALGIDRNHLESTPRATDYIEQMQDLIRSIVKAGHGYASDGSVYFNVDHYSTTNAYGRLFHIDVDKFRKGVRIDADEYDRESVSDFVLWKGHKPGEPVWDFELDGAVFPGRPGWHIECSAMSHDLLGLPFDIHSGGVDLRFPHHEDELAQCTAGYHVPEQANYWMHHEFLEVEGRKMSKSLGNFFTLRDLMNKGLNPLDIRYAMMSAHYRSVYNFTFDAIEAAGKARAKVQEFIWDIGARHWDDYASADVSASPVASGLRQAVFARLADDLHTPTALAELFSGINGIRVAELSDDDARALLAVMAQINDVFQSWEFTARKAVLVPDDIQQLAAERWQAKLDRNWAEADRLRASIGLLGWSMLDGKESYTLEQNS